MKLLVVVLFAVCATGSVRGNAVNDFFNDLEASSNVLNPEADGLAPVKTEEEKAIEQVGETAKEDAVDVLIKLNKKFPKVTPLKVFAIKYNRDFGPRKRLPFVGKWIKETVKLNFAERNPQVAAKLLGAANDLLRIAYVGCSGYPCAKSVGNTHSEYQSLMYQAESVSLKSVKESIKLMKFIRAAIGNPDKAERLLAVCAKIAQAFVDKYQGLEDKVDKLIADTMKANGDVEDVKLDIARKWKKARDDIAVVERKVEAQRQAEKLMKGQVDAFKKRLVSVGINRAKFTAKFLILAGTEVADTQKCDSKVLQNYKDVTNYVTNYIKYSKGSFGVKLGVDTPKGGGNLGIDVKLPDGLKKWTDKKITSEKASQTISRHCWTAKDDISMKDLDNKLKAMIAENANMRQEYLQLLNKLKEAQDSRIDLVVGITEGVGKMGYFNNVVKSDYDTAVTGLAYTTASLKLVKTIFLEAKYFWESQKEFVNDKLAVRQDADALIDEILQEKSGTRVYKERALRTGMNWLAFGTVSLTMYNTIKREKDRVTESLITVLTPKNKKKILKKANKVIKQIAVLRSTIQKNLDAQTKEMGEKVKDATNRLEVISGEDDSDSTLQSDSLESILGSD